jgi:heparosan-N-sulfate-glucuronate 5-epimerase
MKFHLKRFLAILSLGLISIIGWNLFADNKRINNEHKYLPSISSQRKLEINSDYEKIAEINTKNKLNSYKKFQSIDCNINEEFIIPCIKTLNEDNVYIPFNFIKKYFEINGKIVKKKEGKEVFEWNHSYSKVYYPKERYDSNSTFLWFDNYNVEVRDRVKCVSAIKGVPISTQWQSSGHFYPIQIAQFGLSHFSKNLTLERPRIVELDSGDYLNRKSVQYIVPKNAILKRINADDRPNDKVLLIDGKNLILRMKRKPSSDLNLSFDVKTLANFSLTAILKTDLNSLNEYAVTYMTIDYDILVTSTNIIYGIGTDNKWKSLTRDLGVDLQKGFIIAEKKLPIKARNLRLIRLELNGNALIDNIRLASSAHESYARAAADWFVDNQEENGGWSIKANRKLSNGALSLSVGWHSAMAQGQAISLLTRMYSTTNQIKYFDCAKKALKLFDIDSKDNGIKTKFLDKYVWFEEYPTIPSSFVLNGFIYSLFGLYDLKMSCNDSYCLKAGQLYSEGLKSLEKMLPLYDSGSGSMYDLRHFALGSAPNMARWDYHSTHINQLLFLNTIENKLIFQTTAKRWISYMKGNRAPHN